MARPINADLPATKPSTGDGESSRGDRVPAGAEKRSSSRVRAKKPRQRGPIPAALKAIAGLFALALVFILAAILGGGSSDEGQESGTGAAPAPTRDAGAPSGGDAPAEAAADLGFPAFATSNTTRVGGADPASNAAGVALAVYPSTEDALRPSAVALVDAGEWQAAIAAAVLMADPLGAPTLISEAGEVPEATADALDALDPRGSAASKGAEAFAIGSASVPGDLETTEVEATGPAGKAVEPGRATGAAATAAAIARLRDRLFGKPPRHIVVAPLAEPELAMPAAAWAARSGDPVLFAGAKALPGPTAAVLRKHRKAPVYVLGPSSAISSDVVRQIDRAGGRVRRVSGEDPVANAIALARYDDGDFGWNVNDPGHGFVVARSDSPLDAAAAAPLSATGTWGPLLLTDSADTLPAALRGYLLDVKPGYTTDPTRAFYNHVWVIGDEEVIEVGQQAEIDALAELTRIGGEP